MQKKCSLDISRSCSLLQLLGLCQALACDNKLQNGHLLWSHLQCTYIFWHILTNPKAMGDTHQEPKIWVRTVAPCRSCSNGVHSLMIWTEPMCPYFGKIHEPRFHSWLPAVPPLSNVLPLLPSEGNQVRHRIATLSAAEKTPNTPDISGLPCPWRIHGAAIYGAPWIPSIYPLYVSINIPAPWILWDGLPNSILWSLRWPKLPNFHVVTWDFLWWTAGPAFEAFQDGIRSPKDCYLPCRLHHRTKSEFLMFGYVELLSLQVESLSNTCLWLVFVEFVWSRSSMFVLPCSRMDSYFFAMFKYHLSHLFPRQYGNAPAKFVGSVKKCQEAYRSVKICFVRSTCLDMFLTCLL